MDFELDDEQEAFRKVVRDFAESEIAPHAEEWDRDHVFPLDAVRAMGELGLFGLPFPEEYGGSDADFTTLCVAIEELGRVDQSMGITLEGDTVVLRPFKTALTWKNLQEVEEGVVNFTDKKILDEQNIQIIGEQLFSLVDELGRRKLILNFSNVEYLSSAALGKFITLNKKVNAASGKLVLCNIDPQIYEVFEITKLNKLFNIQKEEQAALQAF